jgi:hypothetical protein
MDTVIKFNTRYDTLRGLVAVSNTRPTLVGTTGAWGSSRTTAVGSSRVYSSSALFAFSQARGGGGGGSRRGATRCAFGSSCSCVLWPSPSDLSVEWICGSKPDMMWGVVGRQAGEVGRLIFKVTHCSLCLFLLQTNIPFGLLFQIFSILGLGFRFTPCSMHTCRDRSMPLVTIFQSRSSRKDHLLGISLP